MRSGLAGLPGLQHRAHPTFFLPYRAAWESPLAAQGGVDSCHPSGIGESDSQGKRI
ncbi:hypothetical protein [Chroococcidiopsis cubana]|uniref:hypothetical protein n=1 Tax=Chroococcidiopsis cubana TaxID=171392 RepID=UPI0018F7571E|nr:hypothetical protein [Chroococcidiopsis cubana]